MTERSETKPEAADEVRWKPCPFCAGTEIRWDRHPGAGTGMWHRGDDVYTMCCYACSACFPGAYSLKVLLDKWNRRP
jgi:Lar family restriction alleviation protein